MFKTKGTPSLKSMARHNLWPTPQKRDWKDTPGMSLTPRKDGKSREDTLPRQIYMERRRSGEDEKLHLSADWVEWLMGFPFGFTRLDQALPKERMDEWRRKHEDGTWWDSEPEGVPRVTSDRSSLKERLKVLGNAQVPACAALAWERLTERMED